LILQKVIQQSGATDTARVKAALDAMDLMTFYGRLKFDTDPKAHGLQVGHEMVYIQWAKDKQGKPVKEVVWPEAGATAPPFVCPTR
jgi:branched-chain amino acid transport system substrate-binding protein